MTNPNLPDCVVQMLIHDDTDGLCTQALMGNSYECAHPSCDVLASKTPIAQQVGRCARSLSVTTYAPEKRKNWWLEQQQSLNK